MPKAVWNGAVIAESGRTEMMEGRHYFPADSVDSSFLRDSATKTDCPWKGIASYFHIDVEGEINADAAWYYAEPKPAAEHIRGHVAFWKGVEIIEGDGTV